MVTKFDTSVGSKSSGGGSNILLFLGVIVGGFLVYRYVIKPKLDAKDEDENS